MSETLEELSYDVEDDGVLVRKQLERVLIGRGSWATAMFLFQELDRATGSFGAPKIAVVRFKKFRGAYRKHASFNISGAPEAGRMADVFTRWHGQIEALSAGGVDDDDDDHPDDDEHADPGAEG
jgi:hypothetical protein